MSENLTSAVKCTKTIKSAKNGQLPRLSGSYINIYTILFWEVHGNGCALPLHAVQLYRCVVHLGNMLNDGQPQPGAAGLFAAAFVHSKEAFKDTLPVLLRYADAGVGHL